MSYDNTNKGALFKNKKRSKQTHPHLNGNINAEGTEYWMNAWVNNKKGYEPTEEEWNIAKRFVALLNDRFYLSVSINPKQQKNTEPPQNTSYADEPYNPSTGEIEDEIPF